MKLVIVRNCWQELEAGASNAAPGAVFSAIVCALGASMQLRRAAFVVLPVRRYAATNEMQILKRLLDIGLKEGVILQID